MALIPEPKVVFSIIRCSLIRNEENFSTRISPRCAGSLRVPIRRQHTVSSVAYAMLASWFGITPRTLTADVRYGPGNRSRFRKTTRSNLGYGQPQDKSRGVECVLLHGSLHRFRCSNCLGTFRWDEGGREMETLSGPEPPCPGCTKISNDRKAKGKRATAIGRLRPDIVLYDEQDPRAESISAIARHDQLLCPDVLLIMGTSLV